MDEALNSPVAVIAILAGLAVLIREISWFVRSIMGKSRTYSYHIIEKMSENLQVVNTNLLLLSKNMEQHERTAEKTLECVRELRAIMERGSHL